MGLCFSDGLTSLSLLDLFPHGFTMGFCGFTPVAGRRLGLGVHGRRRLSGGIPARLTWLRVRISNGIARCLAAIWFLLADGSHSTTRILILWQSIAGPKIVASR